MIHIAYAAATNAQIAAQCLVDKINSVFLFPLIGLLSALALLFFLYGAFEYVKNASSETGRETGRRHILYGIIGLLVMLSAYAILNVAAGTFGLDINKVDCTTTSGGTSPLAPSTSLIPQARPAGTTVTNPSGTTVTNSNSASSYTYLYNEMTSNGTTPTVASSFVSTISYTNRSTLDSSLSNLVQSGIISETTKQRVLQDRFGN